MSILTASPSLPDLRIASRSISLPTIDSRHLLALMSLTAVAATLRFWNCNAVLATSDQVALPYLVRHGYGLTWIFAHDYGPILPALVMGWCRLVSRLGFPISDAVMRLPIAVLSLCQIPIAFLLLRRLRCTPVACWAGAVLCAVLPPFVTDAHYPWGYQTLCVLTGSVSLWAMLAWNEERRAWQLTVAALALMAHCLSGVDVYSLPLACGIWWIATARTTWGDPAQRPQILRAGTLGYVLPCVAALGVIVLSWHMTGGGQLGRLTLKTQHGTLGLHFEQIWKFPGMWLDELGLVIGVAAVLIAIAECRRISSIQPRSLLLIWLFAAIIPFTLLTDWSRIGYARHYLFQACFAGAMLVAAWLGDAVERWRIPRPVLLGLCGLAFLQIAAGDVGIVRPSSAVAACSGIRTGWGNTREESGIKAAGYYVRQFVPPQATVMSLHGREGMELPVAEYYCGRRVLAHYDLPEATVEPLWNKTMAVADVVIVDPAHAALPSHAGLQCVCTLRHDGRIVRMIFARTPTSLHVHDVETSVYDRLYDRAFVPATIPTPLATPRGYSAAMAAYREALSQVRRP